MSLLAVKSGKEKYVPFPATPSDMATGATRYFVASPFVRVCLISLQSSFASTFSENLSWNRWKQYCVAYAPLFLKKGQYIAGGAQKALKQVRTSGFVCLWLAPWIKCFQHITLDRQWNATESIGIVRSNLHLHEYFIRAGSACLRIMK